MLGTDVVAENQQAIIVSPEQKPKTLEESLENLTRMLEDNGQDDDVKNLKRIEEKTLADQGTHMKSLMAKYHPQNLVATNLDKSQKTEIFQQLVNVKELIEQEQQATIQEKLKFLVEKLRSDITIPPGIQARITKMQSYLDPFSHQELSREDIEEIRTTFNLIHEKLEAYPGAKAIVQELKDLFGISQGGDYSAIEVDEIDNKKAILGVAVDEREKSNSSKTTTIEPKQDELEEASLSANANSSDHSRTPTSSVSHNTSSELDINAIATITAKSAAILVPAFALGPFGFLVAIFVFGAIKNIGNNAKSPSNPSRALNEDIQSNVLQQAFEQYRQLQMASPAQQKTQEIATPRSTNAKTPDNKKDSELGDLHIERLDPSSIGHLHAPNIPNSSRGGGHTLS